MSTETPDRWPPRPNEDEDTQGLPDEEVYAAQERSDELPAEERPGFIDPERDNPEDPGETSPEIRP